MYSQTAKSILIVRTTILLGLVLAAMYWASLLPKADPELYPSYYLGLVSIVIMIIGLVMRWSRKVHAESELMLLKEHLTARDALRTTARYWRERALAPIRKSWWLRVQVSEVAPRDPDEPIH